MLIASALSASLISAMAGDRQNVDCAKEEGTPVRAFVTKSYRFRQLHLHDGATITVAVSTYGCLARNGVVRVLAYAQAPAGYRLVLDDYSLPEALSASNDGTIVLVSHESVEVLIEAAYVWNGAKYVFSPYRSSEYDVAIPTRRPYAVLVHFAPGANSTTLSGSVTTNLDASYDFWARAGQRITVVLTHGSGLVRSSLFQGDDEISGSERGATWSASLPRSGTYRLAVWSSGHDDSKLVPYALVLSIR